MCFFSTPKVQTSDPAPAPPAPEPVPDSVAPAPNERSMMRGYSLSGRKSMQTYRSDLNIPGGSLGGSGLNVSR